MRIPIVGAKIYVRIDALGSLRQRTDLIEDVRDIGFSIVERSRHCKMLCFVPSDCNTYFLA
jgi:hypothetical protein